MTETKDCYAYGDSNCDGHMDPLMEAQTQSDEVFHIQDFLPHYDRAAHGIKIELEGYNANETRVEVDGSTYEHQHPNVPKRGVVPEWAAREAWITAIEERGGSEIDVAIEIANILGWDISRSDLDIDTR